MNIFISHCKSYIFTCLTVLFAVACFAGSVFAQRTTIRTYGDTDGLTQDTIMAVYQDAKGYLWLGTFSGVVRFNGHRWDLFDTSNGLYNSFILAICGDSNGRVFIATLGGVAIFHKGKFTHLTTENGLSDNEVYDLMYTPEGTLWIMTNAGLHSYIDGKIRLYGFKQQLSRFNNGKLFRDSRGELWIGSNDGLYYKSGDQFIRVPYNFEVENPSVYAIAEDTEGRLLVGTQNGLFRQTGDGFENFGKRLGIEDIFVQEINVPEDGDIWIGSRNGVYQVRNDEVILHVKESNGLSNNIVISIIKDSEENIWFGTISGLSVLSPKVFTHYNMADGLPGNIIMDVDTDAQDRIWVISPEGVSVFSRDMKHQFSIDPRFGNNRVLVRALGKDPNGNMLIGTSNGLYRWIGNDLETIRENIYANRIYTDSKDRIWIGSLRGVRCLGPDTINTAEEILLDENASEVPVSNFAEDSEGRIWIASTGKGVFIIEDDELKQMELLNEFNSLEIWDICADVQGNIWIGTNGEGLLRVKDGKLRQFTTADGLSDNFIWQILPDNNGNLWVCTNLGINYYEGNQFTLFNEDDGLASKEGVRASVARDSSGRLWFGSTKGLSMTKGIQVKERSKKVPILIEKATSIDHAIEFPEFLELQPHNNFLIIQFTAFYYRNELALKYRYRLLNADDNWSLPAHVHEVHYSKLPPGSYSFEVEATSDNGRTWSSLDTPLPIFIATPFYETSTFIGIVAFLTIVTIVGAFRYYSGRERRNRRRLEKLVAERTEELALANENLLRSNEDLQKSNSDLQAFSSSVSHDLRAPLNRISGYTHLMGKAIDQKSIDQCDEYLQRIVIDTRRMGRLIKDLLKLSTSRKAELKKEDVNLSFVCKEVYSELHHSDSKRNVDFQVENDLIVEGDPSLLRIAMENLISNAWKYTAEKDRASINIESEDHADQIVVKVRDNGIGFDQDEAGKLFQYFSRLHSDQDFNGIGIGLVTVKRIIERHEGKVWAEGKPGEGATFCFSLRKETNEDNSFPAHTEKK